MSTKSIYNTFSRTLRNIRYYSGLSAASNEVPSPQTVSHSNWINVLESEFNKEGMEILEIGSRVVTGANFRARFSKANYTGFDFYAGVNVDVVGDAHKLSSYFPRDKKFDLVFSTAVFEHLHMPWVVAEEIKHLLKVGGCVFVETHFSFRAHERPWNFFQFSDMGLRALFNEALGFEFIDGGMCSPMRGYFAASAEEDLRYKPIRELYCHSEVFCRKVRDVSDFKWADCVLDDIVGDTRYPPP